MRAAAILLLGFLLTACSGGEINPASIDVDRLPIDDDGNIFLGRKMIW